MAEYAKITTGAGGVLQSSTGKIIPNDPLNRDWIVYQAWLAVPNVADPDTRTLAGYKSAASAQVNIEAEIELGKHRPAEQSGPLSSLDFEAFRREGGAATAEGTPWSAGYPFLEEQVGIHGADVGIVATYWTGQWAIYEAAAKLIEAAREQYHVDIAAAGTFSAVELIRNAIFWPNNPEPAALPVVLTAPDMTLSGPFAALTLTPDPSAAATQPPTPLALVPIHPDPDPAVLAAPDLTISIA